MVRNFLGSVVCNPANQFIMDNLELRIIRHGLVAANFKNFNTILAMDEIVKESLVQSELERKTLDAAQHDHTQEHLEASIGAIARTLILSRRPWYERLLNPSWRAVEIEAMLAASNLCEIGPLPPYEPAWNPIAEKRAALASIMRDTHDVMRKA